MAITPPQYLLHHDGDNVAVAMMDLQPGTLHGRSVKEGTESTAILNHAIPLGHKFALTDIANGDAIIKYGIKVGLASADIKKGDYIHTHNMRSYRWEASRA
jgi:(2R)-sulfolactate sulfo-lyase subunit alpha